VEGPGAEGEGERTEGLDPGVVFGWSDGSDSWLKRNGYPTVVKTAKNERMPVSLLGNKRVDNEKLPLLGISTEVFEFGKDII